jgi:hypothetical protein
MMPIESFRRKLNCLLAFVRENELEEAFMEFEAHYDHDNSGISVTRSSDPPAANGTDAPEPKPNHEVDGPGPPVGDPDDHPAGDYNYAADDRAFDEAREARSFRR